VGGTFKTAMPKHCTLACSRIKETQGEWDAVEFPKKKVGAFITIGHGQLSGKYGA